MGAFRRLRLRWGAEGGYREFLGLAFPLILSTASWSIQHFVDRVFLAWYSTEALAAALPAGVTNFIFLSFFLGVAQYINTFVAQYTGARHPQRVGPAVWQGVYLALASGLLALGLATIAVPLFDFIGHDPAVRQEEVTYFQVLCYGIGVHVLSTAVACFYTGRGRTWTVLAVNLAATGFNILADYALIFGRWGLPEWGIRGAAWATNLAGGLSALLFLGLFLRRAHREEFGSLRGWRPDRDLFGRLLRFGGPSGLTFMLDIVAFSLFVLIAGRLGTVELAATNLASHINSLAFMPLIGSGIALSTMVGQRLGRNRPEEAAYCTWSAIHLGMLYSGAMAAAYVLVPELFLLPFSAGSGGPEYAAAHGIAVALLRIVALYCVFDSLYLNFTAALKGAGDTRFIMWVSLPLAWSTMVIPCLVGQIYLGAGVYVLWSFLCAYVTIGSIVFYVRFRGGKWKSMRVIEDSAAIARDHEPGVASTDGAL